MSIASLTLAVIALAGCPSGHTKQSAELSSTVSKTATVDPLHELLSAMLTHTKTIRSLAFVATVIEKDPCFQKETHYTLRIKVLILPDGKCNVKLETFDESHKQLETLLWHEDKWDVLVHKFKTLTRFALAENFTKIDLENLRGHCFPIIPLLSTDITNIERDFKLAIVQTDKDYTWIRFVPVSPIAQRDVLVAQIGVINYKNAVSPANYPLSIIWREPDGKEATWRLTKVAINTDEVQDLDFTLELPEYERNGWKVERRNSYGKLQQLKAKQTKEAPKEVKPEIVVLTVEAPLSGCCQQQFHRHCKCRLRRCR